MNYLKLRSALVMYGALSVLTVIAAWVLFGGAVASAAEAKAGEPNVESRLLTDVESVAPGESFRIGLLLEIPKGWHVYWKHPGEAGMATQVTFDLPKGWEVSSLRWPHPAKFTQPGDIVGYGYAQEVLLFATVRVPKKAEVGSQVELQAKADWLACRDKCVVGKAELTAPISLGQRTASKHADLFDRWATKAPPTAPGFTLMSHDGEEVSLSDFRGKPVVLEWFNPDCPFVKRHHEKRSTMADLARKYADQGVVWLAVNSTHYMDAATSAQWHEKWEIPYPVLVDRDGKVGRAYSAKTTPHMYIVDGDGAIVYRGGIDDDPRGNKGEATKNYVDAALKDLLANRPVNTADTTPYGCSVKYAK